jgi:hypothetical protein
MTIITNDISQELNLIARRGDTYEREFVVKKTDESLYDFTGYSAKMQVKEKQADTTAILDLDSGVGGEITLAAGSLKILIPAATMKTILPKNYYFDLQLTYPSAKVKTWLFGRFTVNQDVTR